MANKLPQILS